MTVNNRGIRGLTWALGIMEQNAWPFDQPPNCAAITLRSIVFAGTPILHVTHDADDEGWQFLGGDAADIAEAAVVSMSNIVDLDPTVIEVADMPPGWHAWRDAVGTPWKRAMTSTKEA